MTELSIPELVALVKTAAAEAANFQERFAAEDVEARKIVEVMEAYLRRTKRIVYGGAAINAHLSPETRFYDPRLNLPDYDFMTPDPLQDTANLIAEFKREGFQEVEAKLGIHEGTYKVFVNYRSAADITYMPPTLYESTLKDTSIIDDIRYASPDFLRMNIYVELSRPSGNVSRWEKVYERLLLLNKEHPLQAKGCVPLSTIGKAVESWKQTQHRKIIEVGKEYGAIFLSEPTRHIGLKSRTGPVILMTDNRKVNDALETMGFESKTIEALGELLPARTEFTIKNKLVAVVFETMACHAYVVIDSMRIGSLDLLIHMYYAMFFAGLNYSTNTPCIIQELIELEYEKLKMAPKRDEPVFPLDCVGHQPTMPELKRAHRKRVREKRKELKLFRRSSTNKK
jgi:hypothetical protein